MSWDIFKQNVSNMANNPETITDLSIAAHTYAVEYDACMKRGFNQDLLVTIQQGNVDVMESLFLAAFELGLTQPSLYDIVGQMGKGVIAYWGYAELSKINIAGTIPLPTVEQISQGVAYNVNPYFLYCTNPGQWPDFYALPPTNPTSNMLDLFILSAQMHLTTISGIALFNSYYPASVVGTLPSLANWMMYTIGPSPISPKADVSTDIVEWVQQTPTNLINEADTTIYAAEAGNPYANSGLEALDDVVVPKYIVNEPSGQNPNGYDKPPAGSYGTDIKLSNGNVAYGGFKGKPVDSSYYIKSVYIPALERVHFDKSNGIRLLMQAQTQLE